MTKLLSSSLAALALLLSPGSSNAATFFLASYGHLPAGTPVSETLGPLVQTGQIKVFFRFGDAKLSALDITAAAPGVPVTIFGYDSAPIGFTDASGSFSLSSSIDLPDHDWGRFTIRARNSLYNATATVTGLSVPHVPEPSTWAMLIVGFGLAGSALRLKRNVYRPAHS